MPIGEYPFQCVAYGKAVSSFCLLQIDYRQNFFQHWRYRNLSYNFRIALSRLFGLAVNKGKLSSQQAVSYNGVELVKAIEDRFSSFPMFILTSHESDLYTRELFDAYLVFDFERYIAEELERIELNTKIIEQVKKYRITIEQAKSELHYLVQSRGNNVDIDDQILKLDSFIERSMWGASCLNDKLKKDLNGNNLKDLIERIDILLKR